MEKVFEELGLSKNESKVYLALLSLGACSVSEIEKKSFVYRSNIYDALNRLMEKGLVSTVIKEKKQYYESANPKDLIPIFEERFKELKEELPALAKMYEFGKTKQEVRHFKGSGGISTVLKDINKSKSYDAFGISSNLAKVVPHYFPQWIRERIDKRLFGRMIKTKGDMLATPQLFGKKTYKKLFEVRELSKTFYTPAATFIYGSKVAIILEKVENPLAVIIESQEISDGYRKQFLALWKIASPETI